MSTPAGAPRRLAMVCASCTDVDAILDYAYGLGAALAEQRRLAVDLVLKRRHGWSVRALSSGPSTERRTPSLAVALDRADAMLLHYNPFSWGRWGFAPGLAASLAQARRSRPDRVVGILFHERYVDMHGIRWTVMGAWQRVQFHAILRLADVAFASTEAWTRELRDQTSILVSQIPICSNLPDRRGAREHTRQRFGLDPSTFVVGVFGTTHPSRLTDHIERAVSAVADDGREVVLLNLGSHTPALSEHDHRIRVVRPGRLPAAAVADHLATADLYLAPFADGVSGRRTTLMAALQHGLAVVGTDGVHTDTLLREAADALLLTASSDASAFAAQARALAAAPLQRARQGVAARRLYEAHFDWPIACDVAMASLGPEV